MRTLILRALLLVAAGSAAAGAQAIPSPTAPKRAATNAANKMSAAIRTSENPEAQTKSAPQATKTAPQPSTKAATPATTKSGAAGQTGAAMGTAARTQQPAQPAQPPILYREIFDYQSAGRRDPFLSLLSSNELRPTINDLKLVAVLLDARGRNSVAIMRDVSTKEQYRVKVGQTLGRMRVAQIQPKAVVFSIEEFGYNRQEILALGDTSKARTP